MNAVAILLSTLALVPVATPQQPISNARGQLTILAQNQLPSIDRPVQAHDIAVTQRNNGHFFFDTEVNGVKVRMLFDTGAHWVSLRAEDAARLGIDLGSLNYSIHTTTANGIGSAAPVVIKVMKVGNIVRTNVAAIVMRPGTLSVNLLGQSWMTRMGGYTTEGDTLTLRGD